MPSKSNTTKIKAVPVNTTVIDFEDDEPSQNETQDVLQVIENIETEQQPDEQEVQPLKKQAKAKPRAKPKPIATKTNEDIIVKEQSVENEKPIEEETKPMEETKPIEDVKPTDDAKPEKKQAELVECPNCQKKLTAKTLKYNHIHNCPANKFKESEPKKEQINVADNQEPVIEDKKPSSRELRMMKREKLISTLITQAF